jgi:two-component system phosphate regulon response regulator OmpR
MNETSHILVVDDDTRLRTLLSRFLSERGFRVTVAEDAAAARGLLRITEPDLMVLDVTMQGESGLALTHALRRDGKNTPILLLTARGTPGDRIEGFEAGADDYLAKPFDPRELELRVRALLRRSPPPARPLPPGGKLRLGLLAFDLERGELSGPEGVIYLTGSEAALLAALAAQPGDVLSREDLAAQLDMDETGERAIDVQVTRLRRKIETDPREPRFLHTVRGRGYVLKPGV